MNQKNMILHKTDLCVVGGGLAGTIAALAAARRGAKVVLIQDRPVLGGNASSEIRMWVRGARGLENREGGILAEFEEENIARNPTLSPSLWDSVLFGKIKENKNITLLLNCSCTECESDGKRISSVTAWQLTTYTWHKVEAKYFADCSGDSILAETSGAKYRVGREEKTEYGENMGRDIADSMTMGNSCLLQARETDGPVKFVPPSWANVYEKDEDFAIISYKGCDHLNFRDHVPKTSGCNMWWIELGGSTDSLHDAENVRDELLKIALGVWDHVKNRGDHGAENWELEWVGFLPGKRESRRYISEYVITENDIEQNRVFPDTVAYGGWPLDDHNPLGMLSNSLEEEPSKFFSVKSPYEIPYRCLYSENIENLFFAGRNIGATHIALSSTRVMATCSLLGQAVGNAAAICVEKGITPHGVYETEIKELQRRIMDDGVYLPGLHRHIPELSATAKINLSDDDRAILQNGIEQPIGGDNFIKLPVGGNITFSFDRVRHVSLLRLKFDPDYSRLSVSDNKKMRIFAMKLHTGRDFRPMRIASTLVRGFDIYADGKLVFSEKSNYSSLVRVPLDLEASEIKVVFTSTNGDDEVRIFGCDVM